MVFPSPGELPEQMRQLRKDLDYQMRRPSQRGTSWVGTISRDWSGGMPPVELTSGEVVTAFVPTADAGIQPGATVLVQAIGNEWFITSSFARMPSTLRAVTIAPQNGFSNWVGSDGVTNTFGRFEARRDAANIVYVTGLVARSSVPAAGTVIGVLPLGFRPKSRMLFPTITEAGIGRIDILNTGEILYQSGGVQFLTMQNLRFPSYQATTEPLPLLSGWTNFAPDWMPAEQETDQYGVTTVAGMVKAATVADGQIFGQVSALTGGVARTHHIMSIAGGQVISFHRLSTVQFNSNNSAANTNYHTMAGTQFVGKDSPLIWRPASFRNSWSNLNAASFTSAEYTVTPEGVVHLRGLMVAGTLAQPAFVLPLEYRPRFTVLRAAVSSETLGRLDIQADGSVVPQSGVSGGWFSLDGISYPLG